MRGGTECDPLSPKVDIRMMPDLPGLGRHIGEHVDALVPCMGERLDDLVAALRVFLFGLAGLEELASRVAQAAAAST